VIDFDTKWTVLDRWLCALVGVLAVLFGLVPWVVGWAVLVVGITI